MSALASRDRIRPGLDRPGTAYAWPPALLAPVGGKPLVYLDLNHWIALAQAATGHPEGARHRDALEMLRRVSDRVVLPLQLVHYMEMESNRNRRRRLDVAEIMEELSGFVCMQPRSNIADSADRDAGEVLAGSAARLGRHASVGEARRLAGLLERERLRRD